MDTKPTPNSDETKARIDRIKTHLRVTKVVATRSVKTSRGDFFVGISAAWNTVQDDAGGPGAGMDLVVSTEDEAQNGMTLQDARVAYYLVAMQADTAAYEAAAANGAISEAELREAKTAIRANYSRLTRMSLTKPGAENGAK